MENEAQLVARAVEGDEDALASLLAEHGARIRARLEPTISAKWKSILEADDVLQVTYLEAYLRINRFEYKGEGSFHGWLARIAENNLRDAIKELERRKRPQPDNRIECEPGDRSFAFLEDLGFTTTTPSRHAASREVAQAIEDAISRLPEDYAEVVRQYDLQGRSAGEVAQTLKRSSGAVYMLRARAHDRLREAFESETRFFSRRA